MKILIFFFLVIAVLNGGAITDAQQLTKLPRVGYASSGDAASPGPLVESFRQGLRDLGYVEGKNIITEFRFAEGKVDRMPDFVAEFIQLKVDVIVAPIAEAIRAAMKATKTTPIVIVSNADPVTVGYVDSLARPGGNLTGLSTMNRDLSGKRLELLKEVVPQLSRVAVLRSQNNQNAAIAFKEYEAAARAVKLQLESVEVLGQDPDLETAFQTAIKGRATALITVTNLPLFRRQKRIVELAKKHRLPSMFEGSSWVDNGGLLSYSTDDPEVFRRAATYVDKILKGAKPADLPVEQPTKFELVINLKTAKQIGLTIPPNVLARADKVIR
jgi:putative ABC transport system substrate-binding protein